MPDYDKDTDFYQDWTTVDTPYKVIERYVFVETIGPVEGLDVLDVACGEGRLSRFLMQRGAASVLGVDISPEMIARARRQNASGSPKFQSDGLRYEVVDATDDAFTLDEPVDLVTALYLFHYAPSEQDLRRMCRFIGRNLKPGGRFVHYGINPKYRFEQQSQKWEKSSAFASRP